ncbi:holin-like protein CidA [Paraliobacillus quinghaiensis]|uniref:Holin-like protein CidA n=1 Tax=Paraliobacillus quinghaiensis TaxID=470815 RepID=A0A917WWA6_9BACI|nr:CidA/LrgA family protein [Paraliobacillus quinghaiensis]GGM35689.1 holin-like protein CidA [Paraliobacillus quinghaiensis]
MKIVTILIQIIFIHVFLLLAIGIKSLFSIPLPASMIGLVLLFLALYFKIIKLEWVEQGANWLMAELLLFFIPSAVGIVNYNEIASWQGVEVILIIGVSTFIVMSLTAVIADGFEKLKRVDSQ